MPFFGEDDDAIYGYFLRANAAIRARLAADRLPRTWADLAGQPMDQPRLPLCSSAIALLQLKRTHRVAAARWVPDSIAYACPRW
jgi:hypothetical protein